MPSNHKHARHPRSGNAANMGAQRADGAVSSARGEFIDQTIAIWQKRTERKLAREDGREIIENITGFFSILQEWERRERGAASARRNSKVGRPVKQDAEESANRSPSNPINGANRA